MTFNKKLTLNEQHQYYHIGEYINKMCYAQSMQKRMEDCKMQEVNYKLSHGFNCLFIKCPGQTKHTQKAEELSGAVWAKRIGCDGFSI